MKVPTLVVIDDFLPNPDEVRRLGLEQKYEPSPYYKGVRSEKPFLDIIAPKDIEPYLGGLKVTDWPRHSMNARFQFCTPRDPLVYHTDLQRWAAALYLTPSAPLESGTTLYRHRETKHRYAPTNPVELGRVFQGKNLFDKTVWEPVDQIGNVYNRLVIWDGRHIHAASCYFGENINDARLFMIFFFDTLPPESSTP